MGAHGGTSFPRPRRSPRRRVGEDERELVAADAREHVGLAQHLPQGVADAHQQGIAGGMAERVVDALEAVEVEQHERCRATVAARPADLAIELLLKRRRLKSPVSGSRSA